MPLVAIVGTKPLLRALRDVYRASDQRPLWWNAWPNSVLLELRPGRLRLVCARLKDTDIDYPTERGRWVTATVNGELTEQFVTRHVRPQLVEQMLAREIPAQTPPTCHRSCQRRIARRLREHGHLSIPVRLIRDLVAEMRDARTVVFEIQDGHLLEVRFDRHQLVCHLNGKSADEFPAIYRDFHLGDWAFVPDRLQAQEAA